MSDFLKIIEVENSKRIKLAPKQAKIIIEKKKEVEVEVEKVVAEIRQEKNEKKLKPVIEKPKIILKTGDRVRMLEGKAVGTIDKIEKDKATVNYGVFTSKISVEQLEKV